MGSNSMAKTVESNIDFLISESPSSLDRFKVQGEVALKVALPLRRASENLRALNYADRLIDLAQEAWAHRRFDLVSSIAETLLDWPLPYQYRAAALYFRGLGLTREGAGSYDEARPILESIAEDQRAPMRYRARSRLTLAGWYLHFGDYAGAGKMFADTLKVSRAHNWCDPAASVKATIGGAVLLSISGNHRDAVRVLRELAPIMRWIAPKYQGIYHQYNNSLAVELAECGELFDARKCIIRACNSQYAAKYPEWWETKREIDRGLYRSQGRIVDLHCERSVELSDKTENDSPMSQASPPVIAISEWKDRHTPQPAPVVDERMTLRTEIIRSLYNPGLTKERLKLALQILTPREED